MKDQINEIFLGLNDFSSWLYDEWQRVFERGRKSRPGLERQLCLKQEEDLETLGDYSALTFIRFSLSPHWFNSKLVDQGWTLKEK